MQRGRVVDAQSGTAIEGALVSVSAGEARVRTDREGGFVIPLSGRPAIVEISADGYINETLEVDATTAAVIEVSLFPLAQFVETVEVRAESPLTEEPVAVAVAPDEVLEVAGSLDNVFRTVQTLPGVAATEDFGSRLSVRGGSPDQNLTVMDGVEIHNPYRLFGLTSAFNPETVESFELTAGGFSAKYGDRLSSLLIIRNRDGQSESRLAGSTSASITDANVIIEGGLSDDGARGSWLVTGRRTYYDLVAERLVDENLPSFGDVQAKLAWNVGAGRKLSFFALRSRESTDFSLDEESSGEFGDIANEAGNDLFSVTFETPLASHGSSRTILAWYRNRDALDFEGRIQSEAKRTNTRGDEAYGFAEFAFDRALTVEDLSLREDVTFLAGRHVVETGAEVHLLDSSLRFFSTGDRNLQEANGSSVRGGAGLPDEVDSTLAANRVGAWLQDRMTLASRLTLEPGVRVDWSQANGRTTVSPRLTSSYRWSGTTRLRAALGIYTQSPGYEKLIQSDFFVDLTNARALGIRHERSTQAIAGVERDLTPEVSLRLEGFYKTFDDNIVGRLETEDERLARIARYDFPPELSDSVPTAPIITSAPSNDGSGRSYGVDLYLARRSRTAETGLSGWAAYTWTRAERDDYGSSYPFDYDRRHALNLVGSYRLTRSWTLAATGRFASGFPYTPAVGARVAATPDPESPERLIPETDAEGRYVYAIDLGDVSNLNSGRLPLYARVDLRATWKPGGRTGRFELYLEAINLLNRDNAVRYENELRYDPESDVPSTAVVPSQGFPFLPSFGLRYRF